MYKYELQKSADELIKVIFGVKPGETVVITADTNSNFTTIDAVAASVYAAGGKPMVITIATPSGVGKAADPDLPIESLTGALMGADVWIEMNKQWLLYSTPFETVETHNKKLRYMCLVEFNEDLMVRTIGNINTKKLSVFMEAVADKTKKAKIIRSSNKAGTDVTFEVDPIHYTSCDCGNCHNPGMHMLTGQINVVPRFGTINGTIVFDGTLTPPFGRLVTENVKLTVKDSIITKIEGGKDAREFEKWLKSFDDEGMLKMAHMAYGFNPGAQLTGNIVEDERVWGSTEWGIGYVSIADAPDGGQDAASHCDGICLESTVWLDDVCIMEDGVIIDPELSALVPDDK